MIPQWQVNFDQFVRERVKAYDVQAALRKHRFHWTTELDMLVVGLAMTYSFFSRTHSRQDLYKVSYFDFQGITPIRSYLSNSTRGLLLSVERRVYSFLGKAFATALHICTRNGNNMIYKWKRRPEPAWDTLQSKLFRRSGIWWM